MGPPSSGDDGQRASGPRPAPAGDDDDLRSVPLLLAAMPGGARVGTLVHRVLGADRFHRGRPEAASWVGSSRRKWCRDTLELGDRDAVVAGLAAMIEAPLGPLTGGRRLRDFATVDRLDELGFEFPLIGGDTPTGNLNVVDIAALLAAHLSPDDPLAGYPARLADPALDRDPAWLPVRQPRPRAAGAGGGPVALRGVRLQDELAGRPG